jgi:glutamate--cysteine ligase
MSGTIPRADGPLAGPVCPAGADDLCAYLEAHAKPRGAWRVGLEYELLGYDRGTQRRLSRDDVQRLLQTFVRRGGIPAYEETAVIAVRMPYGDVTLEPGGQVEFSGLPESSLAACAAALDRFLDDVRDAAQASDAFFVAMGFDPVCGLDQQSWTRKQRYAIMRPYMALRGGHAWDMMTRTAAIQTSLDYADVLDLGRKYAVATRLGPIVAAMFANSPFADGVPTGLKTTRYAVWLDTDPDRTGPGPGALEEPFDLHRYAEAVMAIPALFVERDGRLRDVAGTRFDQIADCSSADLPLFLSTIFTEARLREYVEIRSPDSCDPAWVLAHAALWKGLCYDAASLEAALSFAPRLDRAAFRRLQMAVARDGLEARAEGVDVAATAALAVQAAHDGLRRIAPDELTYLDPLVHYVLGERTSPADVTLRESGADPWRALRLRTVV